MQRKEQESTGYNSTCKKLAVQWLNEALCFVSSLVVADSFRLRNPPERNAPSGRNIILDLTRCSLQLHLFISSNILNPPLLPILRSENLNWRTNKSIPCQSTKSNKETQ
jgi:hypothetical protein